MTNVRQWLESLGVGQYADAVEDNDIGWSTLPSLDHGMAINLGARQDRAAFPTQIADLPAAGLDLMEKFLEQLIE